MTSVLRCNVVGFGVVGVEKVLGLDAFSISKKSFGVRKRFPKGGRRAG